MKIGFPDGLFRVCGEAQGYQGLPVRDDIVTFARTDGSTYQSACMVTRWQPTEEERQRLIAGEDVYVRIEGNIPPPIMLGVGDPNAFGW